jgi:hypothetical protein
MVTRHDNQIHAARAEPCAEGPDIGERVRAGARRFNEVAGNDQLRQLRAIEQS